MNDKFRTFFNIRAVTSNLTISIPIEEPFQASSSAFETASTTSLVIVDIEHKMSVILGENIQKPKETEGFLIPMIEENAQAALDGTKIQK